MSIRKYSRMVADHEHGRRLDLFLSEWLPVLLKKPISRAKARKLIVAGAVYLNGKRVRIASKLLLPNAQVEAYVDLDKLFEDGPSRDVPFVMTPELVLYEDEHIIAVNKPAGLPTQPTVDEARQNLFAAMKRFLLEREGGGEGKPVPYLALHHRLDRDTSGVIIFAKTKAANLGVSKLFSEHLAQKVYHAITVRPAQLPLKEWTVKNYLGPASNKRVGQGKRTRFKEVRSGGDFAHTEFKLLEVFQNSLYVEARPRTGRTHQIRVHLAGMGMPILSDDLYGDPSSDKIAPRMMLHAVSLTFPHPVTNQEIVIRSPLPADFKR